MKNSKLPWVFWVSFNKRKWFTNFWKTRGANFMDIQIFKLHISIGMPWKDRYVQQLNKQIDEVTHTNMQNLKHPFSFLVKI